MIEIKGKMHRNMKYIEIDGETYVKNTDTTKGRGVNNEEIFITFKKFDVKEYEQLLDILAEKLAEKADTKEIVRQALADVPIEKLMKIKKEMDKKKPKIRNEKGCVAMKIGDIKMFIRD